MARQRISYQLYSARKFPPLETHLEALAAIGYDAVEAYGAIVEADPEGMRRKFDAFGLACPTSHFPFALLERDRKRAIAIAETLGMETVIVPALPHDQRQKDVAGWKEVGAKLTEHAAALAEAGLKLAWHNHAFEYPRLADGSQPIDHIVGQPGVLFEVDIGWILRAGGEAKAEINRFPGKVVAFHMKDLKPDGVMEEDGWADVGSGTVDWKALWPVIAATGASVLVVEHDNPADWRRSAAISYDFIAAMIEGRS